MENNKKYSFGYKDTDKKIEIEIYGLVFEIKNLESIEELKKIDKSSIEVIEEQIEKILGNGSVDKINKKRETDGYPKIDLNIGLGILGCIFEVYADSMVENTIGKAKNTVDKVNKTIADFNINKMNREERRKNQRNNYNRGYRKGYRRY